MKKVVLIGLLLCALIFTFKFNFTHNISVVKANPADIWVPYNYTTIQAAINAANSGDVIHVVGGPYARIVVNKTVSLVGEGEAVIDGEGISQQGIVNITANGVSIKNFRIRNAPTGYGIYLDDRTFCYLENNQIENVCYGILVDGSEKGSSNIQVISNNITNVDYGVAFWNSSNNYILANNIYAVYCGIQTNILGTNIYVINNLVSDNNVTGAGEGIWIGSPNNTICNNWVSNCITGILLFSSVSSNNTIYHNNFINNTNQASVDNWAVNNKWNLDWPIGGNFWSNHIAADISNGEYQNQPGSDGICDTPYTVEDDDVDKYPLMGPCNRFEVQFGPIPAIQEVSVISNSSISAFQMNTTQKTISFNVSGDAGIGFCRVDIPNVIVSGLWQNNYRVLINNQEPLYMRNWTSGATTYIYFQYQHSTKEVIIIPESQFALIPLSLTLSTIILAFIKKIVQRKTKITPFSFLDSYNN